MFCPTSNRGLRRAAPHPHTPIRGGGGATGAPHLPHLAPPHLLKWGNTAVEWKLNRFGQGVQKQVSRGFRRKGAQAMNADDTASTIARGEVTGGRAAAQEGDSTSDSAPRVRCERCARRQQGGETRQKP